MIRPTRARFLAALSIAALFALQVAPLHASPAAPMPRGRSDDRLESRMEAALARHQNGAPDRDHELAVVADLVDLAAERPEEWLPPFWGAYLLTQVAMAHAEERAQVLRRAHDLLDGATEAANRGRAQVAATTADLHALRSLIFYFQESVAAGPEELEMFRSRRFDQMQEASRRGPDSPAVLVMAATAVIQEGVEERDLRKVLVGRRTLDAATRGFAARTEPRWLSSHFNQEWMGPWDGWVDGLLREGFDDEGESAEASGEDQNVPPAGVAPERDLLPSEALALLNFSMDHHPDRPQQEFASKYLARSRTVDLADPLERLALAEIQFLNFMPDQAHEGFAQFLDRDDDVGRAAWQRILQIRYRAYDQHERVEREVAEYRDRYGVSAGDRFHLFQQLSNMASTYAGAGEHDHAADLIVAEVESLDGSTAFRSYMLPARFFASFAAAGRAAQACSLMESSRALLEGRLGEVLRTLDPARVPAEFPVELRATALGEHPTDLERATHYQSLVWGLGERLRALCSDR